MKHCKKILGIALGLISLSILSYFLLHYVDDQNEQRRKANGEDAAALRSVIAETYITTSQDPEFVNTATKEDPMEIPEKYYAYAESVQGHGRVYVFIDVDGNISAYFGSPEKVISFYDDLCR